MSSTRAGALARHRRRRRLAARAAPVAHRAAAPFPASPSSGPDCWRRGWTWGMGDGVSWPASRPVGSTSGRRIAAVGSPSMRCCAC